MKNISKSSSQSIMIFQFNIILVLVAVLQKQPYVFTESASGMSKLVKGEISEVIQIIQFSAKTTIERCSF